MSRPETQSRARELGTTVESEGKASPFAICMVPHVVAPAEATFCGWGGAEDKHIARLRLMRAVFIAAHSRRAHFIGVLTLTRTIGTNEAETTRNASSALCVRAGGRCYLPQAPVIDLALGFSGHTRARVRDARIAALLRCRDFEAHSPPK
jgi:hypothetical protein